MSDEDPGAPPPTPAEERLSNLLGLLRADPPAAAADLPARVVRTARWQGALRSALRVGGWMSSAATDAVSLVARGGRPWGRR